MIKQIKLLTKINLLNSLRINRIIHGTKSKERTQAIVLLISFAFLYFYLLFYLGAISLALIFSNNQSTVPLLAAGLIVIICLFFSVLRSGDMIYSKDSYDKVISLPIKPIAIVISRFISVYIVDAILSILLMLPVSIIYAILVSPSPMFYITIILTIGLMPLIPMTIGVALGAVLTAISFRLKHIKIFNIVFGIIFTVAIVAGSGYIGGASTELLTSKDGLSSVSTIFNNIGTYFPPLAWFNKAATQSSPIDLLLFIFVSLAFFLIVTYLISKNFVNICSALSSTSSKHNFVISEKNTNSPFKALLKKDLKMYFSSSTYALNSLIGYILLIILAIGVSFFIPAELKEEADIIYLFKNFLPYIMGFCVIISPPTYCAISFEGKNLGMTRSLPINEKQFYNSKIYLNLCIALPCYLISIIILIINMQFNALQLINTIIVPLAYIIFASINALCIDANSPKLDWESEQEIVKQGMNGLFVMLWGLLALIVGASISIVPYVGSFIVTIILVILSIVRYKNLCNHKLNVLGED